MILGKCIYNILSNDADVSGVISTKIYPSLAVEDVVYPYIAYEQNDHEFSDTKDGKSQLDIISYDIEIYSETLAELNDLGIKVRNALDRYSGTVEGIEIQSVKYLAEDYGYSDGDRVYLKIQTYSFRYLTIYNTLSKPTNLNIAVGSSTQLDLTWTDNSTNESGFEIWRSTNLTNWTLINTTAANATSYSDTVTTETQYYYKVTPTDGTNRGESSNIVGGVSFESAAIPSGIAYSRPIYSGVTTSYRVGDEGYHFQNGTFDYTPPSNPISHARLDLNAANPFVTLVDNNAFGNKNRFTYLDGTQTYATNYAIDHLTGLGWNYDVYPDTGWDAHIDNSNASTFGGFTDWRLPAMIEWFTIFDRETSASYKGRGLSYSPFLILTQPVFYSSTTRQDVTTEYLRFECFYSGLIGNDSKTGIDRNRMIVRNHYT